FLSRALGAGISLAAIGAFLSKASAKTAPDSADANKRLRGIVSELPGGATTTVPLKDGSDERLAQSFGNWGNNPGWGRSPPIWGNGSDVALKHNINLLERLDNGLGLYSFSYNGSDDVFVGVMAQEVQRVMPDAVVRGSDGYLRVLYQKLGLQLLTFEQWLESRRQLDLRH